MKPFFSFSLLLLALLASNQPARAQTSLPYAFSVTVTGHGQPLILIPGYSCSGDVWTETIDHLKSRYECHVLTLPGYAGVKPISQPILQTVRDQLIRYIQESLPRLPRLFQ